MYCSINDVTLRLSERTMIELTNPNVRDADSIDEDRGNAAIEDGAGLIDMYLQKRNTLPMTETPRALTTLNIDLAIYYLHNKLDTSDLDNSIPQDLYEKAIATLKAFADGDINLGLEIDDDDPDADNGVEITSEERLFNRKTFGRIS